ncbi:hypothetical protein [Roseovarius aestuariivivens]|uniref:hypothetical protein n=1 Tax=Roseovarius aestuariivivens TaxID=1888910 RepID=UPI0014369020|nr:hypothetical protein [Roseovarius aestuariivivens]
MSEKSPKAGAGQAAQTREARLKAALKANLARRKEQARGKTGGGADKTKTKTED